MAVATPALEAMFNTIYTRIGCGRECSVWSSMDSLRHCDNSFTVSFAVEAGKNEGSSLKVPRDKAPVGVAEDSPKMKVFLYNAAINAALDDRDAASTRGDEDDFSYLFSAANVDYPAAPTPDSIKSSFDNSKPDSPAFPFADTQRVSLG